MEASLAPALDQRPFEHLVLDYLADLEFERGLSRNTLEAYRSDLLQLGGWLERTGADALTAGHADLAGFLSELASGGASPATLQRKAARPRSRRPRRPPPRCSARRRACAPSTATCAARARSPTIRRPTCARRRSRSGCRRSSPAPRSPACSRPRAGRRPARCATARCSS